MIIKSIQTTTVQEAVYEELLQVILSGEIPPGEQLTIEAIAKQMDVSLTPVRMALKKLEAGNFVTIGKNRRIAVAQISKENLLEIFDIRLILECYAAEKACLLSNDAFVEHLVRLNKKCNEAESGEAYLKANQEFHNDIYANSKMPMLHSIISGLWQQVSPYLHILLREEHSRIIHDFDPNHNGIIEAMRDKDPVEMRKWLSRELTNASLLIQQKLYF